MSDEQRVRDALAYELEPWQPNAADLMRRGKRLAWVRRGLAAAGVTALAGTVATVSAAVGGPAPVKNMLAGGGKPPVPAVVPTPMPQTPQAPSVDPTCLPTVPARPQLPKVTVSVNKTIDPNAVPTGKPTLPAKPSLPTTRPSLPGKQVPTPALPDCVHGVPTAQPSVPEPTMPGTPALPTTEPSLPTPAVPTVTVSGGVKITIDPGKQLPTGRPSIPGTPYPTAHPTFPTTKPSLPTPSFPTTFPTGHPSSHR
jgi:hypothetical protein